MFELITALAEDFGILPLYAGIIAIGGFTSSNIRQLTMFLGIACGVYVTMFKVFNLKAKFGVVDLTQYLPVPQDIGNVIAAVVFVGVIGIAAFGMRKAFSSRKSSS